MGAFYSVLAVAQLVGSPVGGLLIRKGNGDGGEREEGYLGLVVFTVCLDISVDMKRSTDVYRGLRFWWAGS